MQHYLDMEHFIVKSPGVTFEFVEERKYHIQTCKSGGNISTKSASGTPGGVNWSEANYLVMDVEHHCHDVLVILLEFTNGKVEKTKESIQVHFGVLPGVHTRLCLPITALNSENLFLPRFPGTMQNPIRGGAGMKPDQIKCISIGTIESVSSRSFYLSDVYVTDVVPEFPAPQIPFTDELGQYIPKFWPGKTENAMELITYLQKEKKKQEKSPFYGEVWSRYGGWKKLQFEASGFFRTHHDGNRWWMVDPEGYAFISTGLDCMSPGETMRVDGIQNLVSWLPEQTGMYKDAWRQENNKDADFFSYGIANLVRAFNNEWWESWAIMTRRRIREWGFNTVANWSQPKFYKFAQMPYVIPMTDFPTTRRLIFRDFPDVFSTEYQEAGENYAKQLEAYLGDPLLIGYFMRNEPHWAFVDQLNITEKMLEHPEPFESKHAFIKFIRSRYDSSINHWNTAWNTDFINFEQLLEPIERVSEFSLQAGEDLSDFNRMMIEQYVKIPSVECKKVDSEHLNLGMRYAWISNEQLLAGTEHFDVFSINMYKMKPDETVIKQISKATGLPVMIGEFHHGAADVGMLSNGIKGVSTQEERGYAYKYYVENGAAISELVGMHYFILNDQALLGRFDGENYQIGAVDVCHRPYEPFIQGVIEAHTRMYEVANGIRSPYSKTPQEIPKTGF